MSASLYDLLLPDGADDRRVLTTEDGAEWSRGRIRALAARMAGRLVAAGAAPGERVAVQVEKSAEALCLYLACLKAGVIFLPLNTAYTPAEVSGFLADAEPALFVTERAMAARMDAVGVAHPPVLTLEADGSGTLTADGIDAPTLDAAVPRVADDVAAILYTSGTTGRAKGAMISHGALAYTARTLVELWGLTANDVLLHALPVFHAHGLFIAANSLLAAGGRMLFLSRFTPDGVIERLPRSTVFMGVPTLYTRLLADPRLTPDLCAGMRLFTCGSAPLTAEAFETFKARTGHAILERYGMTETAIITSNPLHGERIPGTVGFPLPGIEVRATDEAGQSVPPGEVGQLELRGPNLFNGYWRMPEKTAAEFRPDGFFMTGDMGRIAPDGRITLVGRSKDLIISGGYNVYPSEVEGVLARIPGVRDSAVVGVPHPDFGEGVIAVVEQDPQKAPLDPADVIAQAGRDLAKYKLPKRVFVCPALPRNAMGKVQKAELRRLHAAAFTG